MTEKEFVEKIGKLATKDMERSGILASVSVAQACLESGYGTTDLARNANNLFGMKCTLSGNTWKSVWDGKSKYTKITKEEYTPGVITNVKADFRKYSSIEKSINDHSLYLTQAKKGSKLRYKGLVGEKNYRKAIQIIKNGGYATDSKYVDKICNLIERWNLTRFDKQKEVKPMKIINAVSSSKVPKWGNQKKFIAVHYLGVVGQNHDLQSGGYGAHYYIYWDGTIYQRCSHDAIVWQVGTGGYYKQKHPQARNNNTIGIEMCCKCDGDSSQAGDKWYFTKETQESCAWLVRKLMTDENIPLSNVLRHYDIVNKTCLPCDNTELLTPSGWKSLFDISQTDLVAQFNTSNESIEYVNPINIVEPYNADVFECRSLEATKDHRMWTKPLAKNSKNFRVCSWGEMIEGSKLNTVKNAGYLLNQSLSLSDDELRLLVWVQSDGHYLKHHKGSEPAGIEFHLKKERKINAVHNLLDDLSISYTDCYKSDGSTSIRIYDKSLYHWCEKWLHHKCFTYEFINMSQEQFYIFWNELMQADGCQKSQLFSSQQSINLDVVQAICATHGIRSHICTIGTSVKNALIKSDSNYTISTRFSGVRQRNTLVSCVTVPSGFILIRQTGKTFIVGNCPAPYVHNNKYKTSWTWDEFKARVAGSEVPSTPTATQYYRVRKSWTDAKSQIGAYGSLDNAIKACKTGYKVFDDSGKLVYPKTSTDDSKPIGGSQKDIVKAGQVHANNFAQASISTDGVRGANTKKAGLKVLQTAMNLDYKAGLKVDGLWGTKTSEALKGHTVRNGETQYMVTALEILLMLKGYNPGGVECPGVFGSGLQAAVKDYQKDYGLSVDGIAGYNTFKSLVD